MLILQGSEQREPENKRILGILVVRCNNPGGRWASSAANFKRGREPVLLVA